MTCGPTLQARTSYFTCCTYRAFAYQPHRQEFCHRRGVFFQLTRGNIGMACAQAVALRGAPTTFRRLVGAPRRPPPLHMAPHWTNNGAQPSGGLSSDGWA